MRQGALEQKESLVEEKESLMSGSQEARTTVMDETLNEGIVTTMKKTISMQELIFCWIQPTGTPHSLQSCAHQFWLLASSTDASLSTTTCEYLSTTTCGLFLKTESHCASDPG